MNEFQRIAVEDMSPSCIVKANVGSGKTTVLVSKVKYLHEVQGIPYEDMVVLTFTNKAANEIKERLRFEKGECFGTFHSVAMVLLKRMLKEKEEAGISLSGWNSDFSVVDPEEELELAQELISINKLKIKYKNRLKKRLEEEQSGFLAGKTESRYGDDLYRLFFLLKDEKIKQNKMSFSDLIRECTVMLKERKIQNSEKTVLINGNSSSDEKIWPAWILVDEVQDSDRQQAEFLEVLKNVGTHFFAVGDPNQVIYSWRGGTETMFYEIRNRFHAKELSLPVNYRSSAEILEAASRFLQNGGGISGSRESGEKIVIRNHYDPFQEAEYLAEKIKSLHEEGLSYGEIAVFYRKQNQSEILEKIFEKENIPFTVSLKKSVHEIPVLDWMIHVLRFSCFPEDVFAGEAALMDKYYGEGKSRKAAQKVLTEGRFAVSSLYDKMCGYETQFSRKNVDKMSDLIEKEEVGKDTRALQQEVLKTQWYEYWNFAEMLHPTTQSYLQDLKVIQQLFYKILECCQTYGLSVYDGTRKYLQGAALYGGQFTEELKDGEKSVHLMTLHASKGLEFSHVFMIGVNQGLLPLPGKTPESEEEERRLFFVGMTRAKDVLELSYYTNPGQPGVLGGPGWYLKMLPGSVLDWPENRTNEEKSKNLQTLRRAIEENRRAKEEEAVEVIRVSHARYGLGIVISEDEMMIEVEFENFGKKQFVKALSGLKYE